LNTPSLKGETRRWGSGFYWPWRAHWPWARWAPEQRSLPRVGGHATDHLSTNANGVVTVNFSNFKFSCG
jgi:hypothetical protein